MMDTTKQKEMTGWKYFTRKYGRVTILLSVLFIAFLTFTGNTPDISLGELSFGSSKDENVAIQGSKHVNPPLQSEYWTSSKFNF